VKSFPSSFSKRFTRSSPGAVMNIPCGFFRNTFSSAISSAGGMIRSFSEGMNTVPPLRALRCLGGRYMAFPLLFKFAII